MNLGTNGTGSVVEHLTRSTAEMSPHERSAQADTMRRKLVELAAAHNRLVEVVDQQSAQVTALASVTDAQLTREREYNALTGDLGSKIVALELDADIRASSFMARLRWMVLGR